jgi:hypothetical protein
MADVMKKYQPEKSTFRSKFAKQGPECKNSVAAWIKEKDESCYICKRFADTYDRYLDTFFVMYKRDPEFVEKVKNSKLPIYPIEKLLEMAHEITGKPDTLKLSDTPVGVVVYRDGTVIDTIYKLK